MASAEAAAPTVSDHTRAPNALPYWAVIAIILLATVVTRFSAFGDPAYSADDPVFLLIGQAILDGEMPYVEIWDRKPIGLYLIFAGIRLLGGDGVIQSQIVAGLFVAGTALTIERICRHFAGQQGSLLAALTYLIFLPMFRGGAAQVCNFYNLFMALAALLVIRSIAREGPPSMRSSLTAMLLCGVSMILKQTTAIEGALFGLTLLIVGHRRGLSTRQIVKRAALMIAVALLPTLAGFAAFALLGHFQDYWFAAYESNGLRAPETRIRIFWRVGTITAWALPFIVVGVASAIDRWRDQKSTLNAFIPVWLAVALVGFAIIPRVYLYYFIPIALPLAISTATLLGNGKRGFMAFLALVLWTLWEGTILARAQTSVAANQYEVLSRAVQANLNKGCLFVAQGPPLLYLSGKTCRATPYVFPNHLMARIEDGALPVDTQAEIQRILDSRPTVIVFDRRPDSEHRNNINAGILRGALAANYRSAGLFPQRIEDIARDYEIWVRRSP